MPAPDPATLKLGKRAAIEVMRKELQALVRRGYTTAELLDVLAVKGLQVHEETLRVTTTIAKAPRIRTAALATRNRQRRPGQTRHLG